MKNSLCFSSAISANSARKICCIPAWLWLCVNVISCLSLGTLLVVSETGSAPTSLPVTNRPHQSSTGGGTKEDAADSNYHIRNGMIASSILFSLTLIVLIIGILPTFVRLILGRPFLRNKHRVLYDSSGQPVEPPADGCYGAVAAGFDPAACIRFDNGPQGFTDQGARDYQYQLMQQNLTSAATVAAAAAAAAVTAADRQWRIMEGGRRQSKSRRGKAHGGQKPNGNSFFSPNKSLGKANDVESNLSESCSPSGTSDDEEDGSSSEKSNENESEIENRRHSEALLYESGELLINKRKQEKHKKWKAKRRKSSVLSRAKAGDVKAITKWKETIRKALMDACNVLSMIDGRIGGRQTRVIFCISGAGFLPGTNTALMKLANFLRLVDRLLMQPPDGGSSNDVVVMLPPMNTGQSNKEKNAKESDPSLPPTAWTPNVIVLITARIPAYSYPVEGNSYGYLGSAQARELSRSRSSLNAPPFQWTNFKIWWSIHHVCHLPLYLEEDPPGFMAKRPADFNLSSKTYQQQPAYNLPKNASLLNVYLGPHELADLNEKRIRQLVTLTAFMGRMINIDRLVMGQPGLIRLTSNVPKVDANQPSLFTLTTWLSLLVHWPFHAAWLVLFIERHFQSHRVEETQQLDSSRTRRTSSLGGGSCSLRRTQSAGSDDAVLGDGSQPEKSDPIDWDSPLSQLHGRVLKRLASAIESARLKALSASLNAAQTSLDMTPRRGLAYPPHVISTLEICDLALRDRNPKRLAAFLHNLTPGQDVADQAAGATVDWRGALIKSMQPPWHAGMVTVGQLIQVMHLTPFMNPQIINWIRDILFSKVTASESAVTSKSERTTPQRVSVTSETAVKAQRTPPLGSSKLAERSGSKETSQQTQIRESTCPIRLEHGLPSKKLSQLTVNEVCRLLRDIKDLSFNRPVSSKREKHPSMKSRLPRNQSGVGVVNHPQGSDESEGLINDLNPPAPTDRSGEIGEGMQSKFFEERLRHLNVTGSVLSICSLTDLQKELGMSFGDWQLFSALIGHLRSLEGNADKAVGVVNQESGYIRSQLQSTGGGVAPKIPKTKPMTSTTSDTSLALTVKSAPPAEMNPLGAGPSHSRSCKPAKSMISLSTGEGLMARPSEAMWASRGTSAEPGVRSGRERTNREFIAYHHNQHIPGLKDNAEKGLEFPSVVLCPRHQEQVKHLLLETEHGRELQKKLVQSQSELNTTENTNPKGNTEAIRRTDSSFRRSQGMGRYPEVPDNSRPTRFTASMDRSRTLPKSFPVNGEEGETVELANQPNIQFCPTHQLQRDRRQWGAIRTDPLKNIPQTEVQYLRKTVAGRPQIYTKTNQNSSDLFQMGQIPGDSSKIQGYKKDTQFYGLYRVPVLNSNVMNPLEQPLGQSLQEESSAPKDSGSTSIAGEMAEEVAELSPAHPAQESSNSQETEGKSDQDKPEYSDQISGDCCNCSYLYSLEAAAAEAQRTVIDQHEGVRSDEEESRSEQENSTSDTLSTTRSQLDASSGTTSERTTTESSNEHIDRLA
ncbi:unnamed protein product [Calicophoron daubneyi]|uniref:Kinase D-interacting substrate of 220 kDa-like SAM domain-containing protein n=1 Tax=Calicophoron daubneyi TaxID=300641 RepID=A0AAV2TS39_CALDB